MAPSILSTRGLTHRFGERVVLRDVGLDVPAGSLFGFLGPNGAGKTTLIRLLTGLIRPLEGEIYAFGESNRAGAPDMLRRIGTLIESPSVYPHLSGYDHLEIVRLSRNAEKGDIHRVLETVKLSAYARQKAGEYSLGMRQRLGIAMALIGDPELLILDEPGNGLDPAGMLEMRALLTELQQVHGKTVFVSSHLLDEMEKMVSHLAILQAGELLFQGTIPELLAQRSPLLFIETDHNAAAAELLSESQYQLAETDPAKLALRLKNREESREVNRLLHENGIGVYELRAEQTSLEEIFLSLTNPSRPVYA